MSERKAFSGNLDGVRRALVITKTKASAARILGVTPYTLGIDPGPGREHHVRMRKTAEFFGAVALCVAFFWWLGSGER